MRLPKDILSKTYKKPRVFLCEVDKTKICELSVTDLRGTFKFNGLSEISFEVGRTYNDVISGETKVNPYYDKIEALRLIHLEGFGYFELQGPELSSDGIKESKSCTAYSAEYTLSTKYLEEFYINTGETGSVEVTYADEKNNGHIIPVTLYNPANKELSLLHLVLAKDYGNWKIGHVDSQIATLSRQFEVDRESIYDFLVNEVCEKFNCYIVFDTINNEINIYAESLTAKFIGDGKTNTFIISPPFDKIGTVSVNGYKTTRWNYDAAAGTLVLVDTPVSGANIEIIDGALSKWETDVFVTFENLSQEININYNADDIKTVLTVTYGEDGDIREANLGLPYLVDLSYYLTPDWMGKELYDAYIVYQQKCNLYQVDYTNNSQEMLEIQKKIDFEEVRQSLQYAVADNVAYDTVGTYYVRGGTYPNYYYTEVSLPSEYNADITYYKQDGINLTEESAIDLYYAIEDCYLGNGVDELRALVTADQKLFAFMDDTYSIAKLADNLEKAVSMNDKDVEVNKFLNIMWQQVGRIPLKMQYLEPFKKIQISLIDGGYSVADNKSYPSYYLVTLFLDTIEAAISALDTKINEYTEEYNTLSDNNAKISEELLIYNNFTKEQLVRLNAFLREDELQLDDIVETSQDTIADSFKVKQDAMESGRIELNKRCQPQLQFSMSMANIFALPEFEPIIHQFQLGKVIRVGLRPDYKKQSRLLQININFEDFSDFSCEFGELTSLRTQSDIHADLLSQAISAGKSVAQNASYWTRGSTEASLMNKRLEQGLLGAIDSIKSIDGTQDVVLDKYGLHLQKKDPTTGEIDPKQAWMVNNQIVFTDDNFKTSKAALGEFTVDGERFYGLLAQAVIAGYIEGTKIRGGTIQIGEMGEGKWSFEVDEDGNVSMLGGTVKFSTTKNSLGEAIGEIEKNIPTKTSDLINDSGYENATGIVSIIDGTVNADYINALEINVDAANITGKLIADQIDATNLKAGSVDAENITGTTITGKSIVGGDLSIGDKENTYAEITSDGVLNCAGANISGNINATSGNIGDCSISDGKLQIKAANIADLLTADKIDATNLKVDAANITSGTIDVARIPDLSADKITSGTISANRIDVTNIKIDAANITSGTIDSARIGSLSADKITSGTINANNVTISGTLSSATISAKNITAGENDAAITFKGAFTAPSANITGTITAKEGKIGEWTIENAKMYAGDGKKILTACVQAPTSGTTWVFAAGGSKHTSYSDCPFRVHKDGSLYSTKGEISGWIIDTNGLYSPVAEHYWAPPGYYARVKLNTDGVAYGITTSSSGSDMKYTSVDWHTLIAQANHTTVEDSSTSDIRFKTNIEEYSDNYDKLFDNLRPVRYKYTDGTSDRYHTGFIAQEVVESLEQSNLTTQDFAAVMLTNDEISGEKWRLRRDEFVALNTWQIQKLKARVAELEKKIEALQ